VIEPNAENVKKTFDAANDYIDSLPPRWSFTISIDSEDWVLVSWYRWYFNKDEGLLMSYSWEWALRRFWRLDIIP
jgi:hypothetical protein